jgi:hypothetical protein
MKRTILCAGLSALLLSGTALSLTAQAQPADLLGEAVPASGAQQTIVVGPDTHYVNVTGGDIVKFVVGDKSFTWDFDTAGNIGSFDLSKVAPAGTFDHKVMVYVARDPTYAGGA